MPHFGRATQQFKQPLDENKKYRVTAWLNFKQEWNDAEKKYERQSPEEISICRKLFEQLAQHPGLQLQINIDERVPGVDDVKQFPRVAVMNLYVGNAPRQDDQQQQIEEQPSFDDDIPFGNDTVDNDEMVGFE